jgi:hypothetical protein
MRFVRILSVVLLVGFCAVMARADATSTDPIYKFDDPCSPPSPTCLVFTYTGPGGFVPILTFLTPSPDPIVPPPPATTFSCSSDVFLLCEVLDNGFFCPINDFCGVSFQIGFLQPGETVSLSSNEPIPALIVPAGLSPEPTTGLLFVSGFLLVFLGGFARKRFGASFGT